MSEAMRKMTRKMQESPSRAGRARRLSFVPACLSFGLSLWLLLLPAAGLAEGPPPKDTEGFVPESRPANMVPTKEDVPASPLVGAAYGFIWLAVLVFVGTIAARTTRLEGELASLQERLEKGAGR
jgi:hypothetical protein